jgi:putative PEP-CTERM system histidine kinase
VAEWLSDTFNVLSVTVWLVDESGKRLIFGASTSLLDPNPKALADEEEDLSEIIEAIRQNPSPMDIEVSNERWAKLLKRANPDHFRAGGHRVCVPVQTGGEPLGLIMLGDRVSGAPFLIEDLELLKCIGDQVGSGLLGLRLSGKLVQAKELEAFQTISAFFVHDLKNTAHTLSLMLQNLPAHFDNPAFRQDALQTIGKGAQRLNEIINRLSLLRHEAALKLEAGDLNEVVISALAGLEPALKTKLTRSLPPLPKIMIDANQLQKVVTNLVLNAQDAVGEAGEIGIETGQSRGWLSLNVKDNGCGMSREFISGSLFRPFRTTKKKGIGIGLYHCKAIVEAHRGRIEVESEEGKGTSMRVLLPLMSDANPT